MMDLQKLMDAMNESGRIERSRYHLTLGKAIKKLAECDQAHRVYFDYDTSLSPGSPHSYRGFYSDLSFDLAREPITVAKFAERCQKALGETFEGYRGGDFLMDDKTPLWAANYGCTGRAIIGLSAIAGNVILTTTELDDY